MEPHDQPDHGPGRPEALLRGAGLRRRRPRRWQLRPGGMVLDRLEGEGPDAVLRPREPGRRPIRDPGQVGQRPGRYNEIQYNKLYDMYYIN